MALCLHVLADVVQLLSWEWSFSHPRSVGFGDPDDSLDGLRRDSQPSADAADVGGGSGHIGVGAVVYVKHSGIGAFGQNPSVGVNGLMHELNSISHHVALDHPLS